MLYPISPSVTLHYPLLGSITLCCSPIGKDAISKLSNSLGISKSLLVVNLSDNPLRDAFGVMLGHMLPFQSWTIQSLNLSRASLGDKGVCAIAASMLTNTKLLQLNLGHNTFSDQGAEVKDQE